jgi:RND family efflux transporter MFP subunit
MTPPQLIILLLVVAGMALLGNFLFRTFIGDGTKEQVAYQTATVQRRTIESTVNATGTVSATKQVRMTFSSTGQVQDVYVKQGDHVVQGQPLAALNTFSLEVKRDQARTTLNTAQLRLDALLAGATSSDIATAQQTVATAQSGLTRAQNDLFNLLAGATPDEVAAAKASLDSAQAGLNVAQQNYDKLVSGTDLQLRPEYSALQTAKSNYQSALTLYSNRTAPANPLDVSSAQASVTTAQSSLDSAKAKLTQLQNGPEPLDVANARNLVSSSEASLTAARARLAEVQAGQAPGDIVALQAQVASAQASVQAAQARLQQALTPANTAGDVASAQAQVNSAQAALAAAQAKLTEAQSTSASAQADINSAQANLASAQANFTAVNNQYSACAANSSACTISSPTGGLVLCSSPNLTPAQQLQCSQAPLDAQARIAAAQAQVTAAQATLTRAQQNATPTQSAILTQQQAVAAAQAQLASAQNLLAKAQQAANNSVDVATAQQGLAAAQAQLLTAQNNLAKAQQGPTQADLTAAQQSVALAETNLKNAQNNLAKLLQPPTAADLATAQQAVTSAESALRTARNSLDKLLVGSTPEDIASARAALENAKSQLDTAQTNWDRLVAGTDLDSRTEFTALAQARSLYQTALTNYNTKTAPPKPGDVAAAQANVDSANATVNAALARLAQVLGGALPTDIGQAREAVASAELALKQAQNDLDNGVLKAPFPGTVVTVGINPGDQVGTNTAAVTMLDPDLIRVDANVDESNIVRLRAGMPVTVTFDALQGRQFQGVVAVVTPSGVTQQGVVIFPVTVVFNALGFTIPPGTTANLRIVTDSKQNVLAVSTRAIQRQGRNSFVNILQNGKLVQVPVTTGLTGDGFTEITSGLEDEQVIVTSVPQATGGGAGGAFGAGGLPGLGTGAPAPAAPQPVRR